MQGSIPQLLLHMDTKILKLNATLVQEVQWTMMTIVHPQWAGACHILLISRTVYIEMDINGHCIASMESFCEVNSLSDWTSDLRFFICSQVIRGTWGQQIIRFFTPVPIAIGGSIYPRQRHPLEQLPSSFGQKKLNHSFGSYGPNTCLIQWINIPEIWWGMECNRILTFQIIWATVPCLDW